MFRFYTDIYPKQTGQMYIKRLVVVMTVILLRPKKKPCLKDRQSPPKNPFTFPIQQAHSTRSEIPIHMRVEVKASDKLRLLRITRTRTSNAATDQVAPTARTRTVVVRIGIGSARAGAEKRGHRSSCGLGAVAGWVEADGARAG